ncbi:MAG: hypothetical protein AAGC74_00030 [Verrucomicrobiota bacterium]
MGSPLYLNEVKRPASYSGGEPFYSKGIDIGNATAYTGYDITEVYGSRRSVLFEVPRRDSRFVSIGELMHANLFKLPSGEARAFNYSQNFYLQGCSPTYAIGNSAASAFIPLDRSGVSFRDPSSTALSVGGLQGAHYDYSYLLNQVLWDDLAFSSLERGQTELPNQSNPLANSRMRSWPNADQDTLHEWDKSLACFYVDGGFNVNSVSVAGWTALLSAFRGLDLPSESGERNGSSGDDLHTFARSLNPEGGALTTGGATGLGGEDFQANYAAYRRLSDEQIQKLAEEIVSLSKQRLRSRGGESQARPFLSLGEFVNRSIETRDLENPARRPFTFSGILQKAIDRTSINSHTRDNPQSGLFYVDRKQSAYFEENLELLSDQAREAFCPGNLTQADILARIGAVLTVRSDTFRIRAYGTSKSQSGKILSEAFCEAIVQRVPDFLGGEKPTTHQSELSDESLRFGRRFLVTKFRWLNPQEI